MSADEQQYGPGSVEPGTKETDSAARQAGPAGTADLEGNDAGTKGTGSAG